METRCQWKSINACHAHDVHQSCHCANVALLVKRLAPRKISPTFQQKKRGLHFLSELLPRALWNRVSAARAAWTGPSTATPGRQKSPPMHYYEVEKRKIRAGHGQINPQNHRHLTDRHLTDPRLQRVRDASNAGVVRIDPARSSMIHSISATRTRPAKLAGQAGDSKNDASQKRRKPTRMHDGQNARHC